MMDPQTPEPPAKADETINPKPSEDIKSLREEAANVQNALIAVAAGSDDPAHQIRVRLNWMALGALQNFSSWDAERLRAYIAEHAIRERKALIAQLTNLGWSNDPKEELSNKQLRKKAEEVTEAEARRGQRVKEALIQRERELCQMIYANPMLKATRPWLTSNTSIADMEARVAKLETSAKAGEDLRKYAREEARILDLVREHLPSLDLKPRIVAGMIPREAIALMKALSPMEDRIEKGLALRKKELGMVEFLQRLGIVEEVELEKEEKEEKDVERIEARIAALRTKVKPFLEGVDQDLKLKIQEIGDLARSSKVPHGLQLDRTTVERLSGREKLDLLKRITARMEEMGGTEEQKMVAKAKMMRTGLTKPPPAKSRREKGDRTKSDEAQPIDARVELYRDVLWLRDDLKHEGVAKKWMNKNPLMLNATEAQLRAMKLVLEQKLTEAIEKRRLLEEMETYVAFISEHIGLFEEDFDRSTLTLEPTVELTTLRRQHTALQELHARGAEKLSSSNPKKANGGGTQAA